MTDSIIQFKYSDDIHMVAIYIRGNTYQDYFISFLYNVIKSCEHTNKNRSWGYTVAEIISKITIKYESLVQFILESQIEPSNVIYKYEITITSDIYQNKENNLIDFCRIKYINENNPFDGLLKNFYSKIIEGNNEYKIKKLEEEIKEKQEELNKLKLEDIF